jgi:tetratricopeptide (TPR) repeat protein
VIRTALEIFTRLQLWEDVISCHQLLEQPAKAEGILLNLLESNPTSPKFHCLMGDVKGDPVYYEKAWALSGGRFARAMRSLGVYYFKKQEYAKSIECYHKALALNPLFENSWFVMGCAAMRIEDWDVSLKAFHRVTQMDSENGEAWTNLASVYIRQSNKRQAWRSLKEALRSKFDSSNIWENYLFVSMDLLEFAEAIRAFEMVFELRKDKPSKDGNVVLDLPVLELLVHSIMAGKVDANGEPSTRLIPRLTSLLNLFTSKINSNGLYFLMSEYYEFLGKFRQAIEFKLKAYRSLLPTLGTDEDVFKMLAHIAVDLSEAHIRLGPQREPSRMASSTVSNSVLSQSQEDESAESSEGHEEEWPLVCPDWKYQAMSVLKPVISRSKAIFEGHPSHDLLLEQMQKVNDLA